MSSVERLSKGQSELRHTLLREGDKVMTSTRGGGMKTVNRSKRIEMGHHLKVASPCHGPGATAVRAEILRRFRPPWMGRNLSRRNLPGLGFAVPLSGLPGLSASLCGNTRRPSAKHFARRGFLRAPPLPPGHNPSGSHENSRKCQTLIVTPAEPGVYLRAIRYLSNTRHPPAGTRR